MDFEWDPQKAAGNERKHGVSFLEAASVLRDPLSVTASDPDHSLAEFRFITVGYSSHNRLLIVSYTERDERFRIISARPLTRKEKKPMKRSAKNTTDELRPEYNLSELLKGGVVGKHSRRFQAGITLVPIDPEVHDHFKTDKDVNDALRLVIELRKIGTVKRPARRPAPPSVR